MKILNKIALVLGWIDIILFVIGLVVVIIQYALSLAFLLIPVAIVVLIIYLLVKKK